MTQMSPRPANRRVTMQDVAQEAGVSQSTVSFVLNDVRGMRITAETRTRVREAARRLGYRRKAPTWRQLGELHPTVGMLVDEIATSPMAALSVDGAQEAAWELGHLLLVARAGGDDALVQAALTSWRALGVVGVIHASVLTRELAPPPAASELPMVLLNAHCADPGVPWVVPDEVTGSFNATAALIERGHERVGFINGEAWMEASGLRARGYRRALTNHDIPLDRALQRTGNFLPRSGHRETLALMHLDEPPTAIFCANDLMAVGAYEALKELGLRIPDDVSVMGYDDQEIARQLSPPLSTVLLPHREMGRWTAEYLISTWQHRAGRAVQLKMDCPVIVRGSI